MTFTDSEQTALNQWFTRQRNERIVSTSVIADGLNLVVAVSTATGDYVLRRPNEIRETPQFVDTKTEYDIIECLAETEVPVPKPIAHCRDESILGAPFVVMSRLDGDVIPLGSPLPRQYQYPIARKRFAHEVIDH